MLGAAVIWGFNYTSVKIALRDFPPLAFGFMRFAVASTLLMALLVAVERGVKVARRDFGRLALMGTLSIGINQVLFLDGLHRTSASIAAIMFACASAFTILLATLLLGERAGKRLWLGIVLATAGIGLIVGMSTTADGGSLLGEFEVFLSSLAVGLSALLAKGVLRVYSALRVAAWTSLCGVCFLAPFAAGVLPSIDWRATHADAWEALAFTAVGASVITLMLWNAGLSRVGVTRATVYSYLQPILGVASAAVILGDQLSVHQILGGGIALLGTWLATSATFAGRERATPTA